MMSIAIASGMELHKVDIEQAFLQADKLDEGVNGRYFINPPPGSPEAGNKDVVYEVLKPLYGSPSSPRALHKTMDAYFKSEGFDTIGFEESVWVRPAGGKQDHTQCTTALCTALITPSSGVHSALSAQQILRT